VQSKAWANAWKERREMANVANRASFAMPEHLNHDFGSTLFMFHNENVSRRFVFHLIKNCRKIETQRFKMLDESGVA